MFSPCSKTSEGLQKTGGEPPRRLLQYCKYCTQEKKRNMWIKNVVKRFSFWGAKNELHKGITCKIQSRMYCSNHVNNLQGKNCTLVKSKIVSLCSVIRNLPIAVKNISLSTKDWSSLYTFVYLKLSEFRKSL